MWVNVTGDLYCKCVENEAKSSKRYKYISKLNDNEVTFYQSDNSPTACSNLTELHKFLKASLSDEVAPKHLDSKIIEIKNELEQNIEKPVKEVDDSERKIDEKYTDLYTSFCFFLKEYDMTPLELIVATTHCLGVGKPREIVRAFIGYFQTFVGYKGTNVIAIGSPASGKSFILETALSMIPDEQIIKGAKTVAYFFNKYNGKDLSGYIFFIGDLGGDNDNQNTIEFRDLLKQLSTDGYAERGVMDKESMEEQDQTVVGYPSLSYTTAKEEMVNEQEKTRSVILTPNPIDSAKLIVFNFLMENHGIYHEDIEKLLAIRDSIKGLVYSFNPNDYDFFNPYMFSIEDHIKDHDDFNRKILEFNAILKLVTLLNNPKKLKHNLYFDEQYNQKETDVILASKRDNLNALNIFDSANLLPDESRFANGIISEYEVFDIDTTMDEDALWEDWIKQEIEYYIDEDGKITIDSSIRKNCFTKKSLARDHRNKRWYRKSKNYIDDRMNRLVDEGVVVVIGHENGTNHNIYCLNEGMESSVDSPVPNFNKEHLEKAKSLFSKVYPSLGDEFDEFVKNDTDCDTTDLFEQVQPIIPTLPFLESVFDEL